MTGADPSLKLNKIHYPVTALGPGRRVALWLQGCHVGCHGCLSLDTWDADGAPLTAVSDLATQIIAILDADLTLTGITVSGGEPSEQSAELVALIQTIRAHVATRAPTIDVLMYSGLTWRRLVKEQPELVASVDAVIPEPFVAALAPGGRWRGSSNQPLMLLTDLAQERYAGIDDAAAPSFQIVVDGGHLWTIGVPRPGDLDRVLDIAAAHGVTVQDTSWRP
jgi:anaerobic ribonucleoside-triphosphate reductase activating protein